MVLLCSVFVLQSEGVK
uniref:Uncharacterized protein n=1 Tax=Anopheles arabiensis TaxID=7173 RepID=A0A182IG49_ANOAR